jgi:carbon monoxide dehydrogenase subunit G
MRIAESITIERPPEAVWEVVSDLGTHLERPACG